jgi:anti-sigma factor RsiW
MADAPLDEKDREDLIAYLDGEADNKTARAIESKLATDPEVRKEADALKKAWDLLEYLPRPEPSPNFTHKTMERLTVQVGGGGRRGRWRIWLFGSAWAASVLIAAGIGFGGASYLQQKKQAQLEQQLVRELHAVENLRAYEQVDDIDFLHKLANPNDADLFGDENGLGS